MHFENKGRHKKKPVFFLQKNSERGGGGLAESEISLSEKTGASELMEGGRGGVSEFRGFSEEKKQFFFYAFPKGRCKNMFF